MAVVLQEYGSPALAAAVDECTVPVLAAVAGARSVRDVLDRIGVDAQVDALMSANAPATG
jgi:hypothetical protein